MKIGTGPIFFLNNVALALANAIETNSLAGELLDADYFYLFYIPVLLSVAAAIVRRKSLRVWIVLFIGAFIALAFLPASHSNDIEWSIEDGLAILILSVLPPLVLGLALRLKLFANRPLLILVAGPLLYWATFILGVNLWLLLGFSL